MFSINFFGYFNNHDGVIKWKPFPRYWLFVRGIHRSPVDCPHKGQWRGASMFPFYLPVICAWTIDLENNRNVGDLRRHLYDVTVMTSLLTKLLCSKCLTKYGGTLGVTVVSNFLFSSSPWSGVLKRNILQRNHNFWLDFRLPWDVIQRIIWFRNGRQEMHYKLPFSHFSLFQE